MNIIFCLYLALENIFYLDLALEKRLCLRSSLSSFCIVLSAGSSLTALAFDFFLAAIKKENTVEAAPDKKGTKLEMKPQLRDEKIRTVYHFPF